ncbi:type VI secretion protein IcmF/TssM N-terminal domain-containing protein [Legionella genomosp. 1]|uniref:type VI secretion protein IcmF/TssM N-terminal domain-containing protein n=1 Tax=Legionella genomosp. 1 TaxID=1093625 RepID=UPI001055965C|nr:type VI secretion protein IcmF/TssM N-terminal domain-containing protein [Legionella genomosp. 1]
MRLIGQTIFWMVTLLVFGFLSTLLVVGHDFPIWMGPLIFVGISLVFYLLTSMSYGLEKWWRNRKNEKQKAVGEKVETGGLSLTLQNAVNYIHQNSVAGGVKRFWHMPWVLFFGSPKASQMNVFKLHTHFSVGDTDDIELQRNKAVVLEDYVIWYVDDTLLQTNTPRKIERQWQSFLETIRKGKKKQPAVQQIVVEIPASLLTGGNKGELSFYARSLRDRINQVSNITGYRQQVLFIITECQHLEGFDSYVQIIPENMLNQAMGYVVDDPMRNSSSSKPIQYLSERAQDVIDIILFNREKSFDSKAYRFPLSIGDLKEQYTVFSEIFFSATSYSESPVLLGVYMTGTIFNKGMEDQAFAYDLIDKIQTRLMCPMMPLKSEMARQQRREYIKLGLWYLACFGLAGYLYYVYTQTSKRLLDLVQLLPAEEVYGTSLEANLVEFNEFHILMNAVDRFKNQWQIKILPYRGGLDRLYDFFADLYVTQFKSHALDILDAKILSLLRQGDAVSDREKAYLVQNMVTRVNTVQAKMGGSDRQALMSMPNPEIRYLGYNNISEDIQNAFGVLYKDYIYWNSNTEGLRLESIKLLRWLEDSRYLNSNLHWLVEWGNTRPGAYSIGLNDFWPGSISIREYDIQPAFTIQGDLAIQQLLEQIEYALPVYIDISRQESNFKVWYEENRVNKWEQFSFDFSKGQRTLAYQFEWDQTFDNMMTPNGVYFSLMDRINNEFSHKLSIKNPRWIEMIHQFAGLLNYQYESTEGVQLKELSNTLAKWGEVLNARPSQINQPVQTMKTTQTIKPVPNDASPDEIKAVSNKLSFDNQVDAAKAFLTYRGLLRKLYAKPFVQSVKAYASAKSLYESQSSLSRDTSNVIQAYQALLGIRRTLDHYDQLDETNAFWVLMRGPLDFYIDYTNRYASCYIQQKWLDEVYLRTATIEGEDLNDLLFGKAGVVYAFHEKYTKPFIKQVGNNFVPIYVLKHKFPLSTEYYQFLKSGLNLDTGDNSLVKIKKELDAKLPTDITIRAKPVNLQLGSTALPYKTVLNVKCNDDMVSLENFNYPSQRTIRKWTLESCGPVEIDIYFPAATLTIQYAGNDGFLRFLQDYSKGIVTYPVSLFPDQAKYLRANRINAIHVYYSLSGADDVTWQIGQYLAALKQIKVDKVKLDQVVKVPRVITDCWEQES